MSGAQRPFEGQWALILGASSGFGAATARSLARRGANIAGLHLDRRARRGEVEQLVEELRGEGVQVHFHNGNAAADKTRRAVFEALDEAWAAAGGVQIVLHSLAFGTLLPLVGAGGEPVVTSRQMVMTLDIMAHSLVTWVQDLVARERLARGGRIFALTSIGSQRVWPNYGAVSAAKAALEAHIRQLALELAPLGVRANALLAGVTDTPALRKIPGHDAILRQAAARNPSGRLTRPEDVAEALVALALPEAHWITGTVIAVDGGENIVA